MPSNANVLDKTNKVFLNPRFSQQTSSEKKLFNLKSSMDKHNFKPVNVSVHTEKEKLNKTFETDKLNMSTNMDTRRSSNTP